MISEPDDRVSRNQRDWIDALAEAYAPEPRTTVQRRSFVASVVERAESRRWRGWAPIATLATAAVAAIAVLAIAPGLEGGSDPVESAATARGEVLVALALGDAADDAAASEALPDDFAALEEALGL